MSLALLPALYDPTDRLWKAWWSTVVFTSCVTVTSQREIHIINNKFCGSPN